jgi:hypothetical protein
MSDKKTKRSMQPATAKISSWRLHWEIRRINARGRLEVADEPLTPVSGSLSDGALLLGWNQTNTTLLPEMSENRMARQIRAGNGLALVGQQE